MDEIDVSENGGGVEDRGVEDRGEKHGTRMALCHNVTIKFVNY